MPGHNHYANCACGWCVNNGRTRTDPRQLREQLRLRDAFTFLERNSAKYISACYINPNARCPVCSSPVYFYANQFGSRVYFDEIGPPWPKHPCTDNPRRSIVFHASPDKPPTRRALGLTQELVTNFNTTGMLRRKVFGTRNPHDWTPLVITVVERRAEENFVKAEYLDSMKREQIEFRCVSTEPLFEVGSFVSCKGSTYSLLHPVKLLPVIFTAGSRIEPPIDSKTPSLVSPVRKPIRPDSHVQNKPERNAPRQTIIVSKSERKHFRNQSLAIEAFCETFRSTVKQFSRENVRLPRDVARRLNLKKMGTAANAPWTPRLAYILLGYLFEKSAVSFGSTDKNASGKGIPAKNGMKAMKPSSAKARPMPALTTSAKTVGTYEIQQSFSHGRKRAVHVVHKKTTKSH